MDIMEDGNPRPGVLIIILLILFNAFLVVAKTAFDSINESMVRKKAEEGEQRAFRLSKLFDKPEHYRYALLFAFLAVNTMIGVVWMQSVLPAITGLTEKSFVKNCYSILYTLLLVMVSTLFGAILPQKCARKYAQNIAYRYAGLIALIGVVFWPVTWILEKIMRFILRIVGIKGEKLPENITEDELISMVNEGHEQGVFDADEVEMISNIIELDEKEAQDIMTPKKRIIAVNATMTLEKALQFMLSEKYTRYPLFEDNRDNIIGILHLKDVITAYITKDQKNKTLKEIAREAYYVPDTQNINILFHEMQSKNIHMAIVIDEYGQTAGLVAMEDFIEEIVGNIQDEYDEEEKLVIAKEADSVIVKGIINLEDLEEETQIDLLNEDFDTLNGLLISLLDRIPADGEQAVLEYGGYQFEVLETKDRMIEQVRISKLPGQENEEVPLEEVQNL
ncbi:MAG: HlyC/CorC family transporter [Lachnospiraceae bacterium]|jgi:putative hemolysin|nr:HlyC/CorC family transporter [Lachnospiraceae bacterium]